MVYKPALWAGFGIAVRVWQLGIEMRPLFNRGSLWVYPLYAGIGGGVGFWLLGVEERQAQYLEKKRDTLLEKRRRQSERDREQNVGTVTGLVDSVKKTVGLETSKQEASDS